MASMNDFFLYCEELKNYLGEDEYYSVMKRNKPQIKIEDYPEVNRNTIMLFIYDNGEKK